MLNAKDQPSACPAYIYADVRFSASDLLKADPLDGAMTFGVYAESHPALPYRAAAIALAFPASCGARLGGKNPVACC